MAVDLRTTQEYLNAKAGTVGLTKQQALQYLAGAGAIGMTAQDAALNYAGLNTRTHIQDALNRKVGVPITTAIDQQQTTNSATETFGNNGTNQKIAQSFIPSLGRLKSITIQRRNSTGTYTGNVSISIQTDSNGSPSGNTAIFISTIANATWEAITQLTDSVVTIPATLNLGGDAYWIVFESSTQDADNKPNLAGATGNPYSRGTIAIYNGTSWSTTTDDIYFKTTCEIVEPLSSQEATRRL